VGSGVGEWKSSAYWDVTDGWEAVGNVVYRLLMLQALRSLRPECVVLPVGTGNLALGAVLAARDVRKEGVEVGMYGAVPFANNVFRDIARTRGLQPSFDLSIHGKAHSGRQPLAPKIAGTYTPLLPALAYAQGERELIPIEVSAKEQSNAANDLLPLDTRLHVRYPSEPSALISFAALTKLRNSTDLRRVLVVNSGNGVLTSKERAWMRARLNA